MPVLSAENGVLKVCVGEVEHPSIEKHWIPFVAVKAARFSITSLQSTQLKNQKQSSH